MFDPDPNPVPVSIPVSLRHKVTVHVLPVRFRLHNLGKRRKTSYLEHGSGGVGLGTLLTFELLLCHVAGLVVLPQALLITKTHSNYLCTYDL
jgi:hypothetical protein